MVSIRPFSTDDLDDVVAFSLRAWAPVYASLRTVLGELIFLRLHPDWRADQERAVRATCLAPDNHVLVAVAEGTPIGFAVARAEAYQPRMGAVEIIAVDPTHHRRGTARQLMTACEDYLRDRGMDIVVVETGGDPGHAPARGTYEASGYTQLPIARYFRLLKPHRAHTPAMPMSSAEGKDWLRSRVALLAESRPLRIVDVGPGVGTYAKLLRGLPVERMTGIEAWEPYVTTYRLDEYYDEIIVGDARQVDLPPCDVVIFGDVLEHMTRADGIALWQRAAGVAALATYLSIPIVHYPQHEIEGNPYEVHVEEDWSHESVLANFAGIGEFELGSEVGAYERLTAAPR